jgi:hypothetical protein
MQLWAWNMAVFGKASGIGERYASKACPQPARVDAQNEPSWGIIVIESLIKGSIDTPYHIGIRAMERIEYAVTQRQLSLESKQTVHVQHGISQSAHSERITDTEVEVDILP